jgi:hypothetical protein
MLSDLSQMAQNLIALVIGGAIASILAAIFLVLYRLFVGRGRPYWRDFMGSATAAFGGAIALAAAGAVLDSGGNGTQGMGSSLNGWIAAALAAFVVIAGLVYARRVAGYQNVRSAASDIIPLVLATAVGIFCTLILAMLEQFS